MEAKDKENDIPEKDKDKSSPIENDDDINYHIFFKTYEKNIRKKIFDIIYNYLSKESETTDMKDSPEIEEEEEEEFIKEKDDKYINKSKKELLISFKQKEQEINKDLEKYEIRLKIYEDYYIYLEDIQQKFSFKFSCLRNIKFGNDYEWICNSIYLLYFQYKILKYTKPSRILCDNENDEKKEIIETIDSISKANDILTDKNLIRIIDTGVQNIDYNKIFEDGNKKFDFAKDNILKYLNYNVNDDKQIIDSEDACGNNYDDIISFSFEPRVASFIYCFQSGYYFFEYNLIKCLNTYQKDKKPFLYININDKNLFKEYFAFWLSNLFIISKEKPNSVNNNNNKTDDETIDKNKCVESIEALVTSILKNKSKYLEEILDILDNQLLEADNGIKYGMFNKKQLVILNNIDFKDIKLIQKKRYIHLNILFILNIQYNFDIFISYFYDKKCVKKFFLEKDNEIIYESPKKENNKDYFYSIFESNDEYQKSRQNLINETLKIFGDKKEKLLNISFIVHINQFIKKINNERNFTELKSNLGMSSYIQILKPFISLININVSVKNNSIYIIENIKFKEKYLNNFMKEIYKSNMINYLNTNSNQFFLNDLKGPLLEKDLILNILTGQLHDNNKYKNYSYFKEIKLQSIYCLNCDNKNTYENNEKNNIVITQENQTAELYDFGFKINYMNKNYMKFGQVSIFKDDNDLEKLNKKSIIMDIINFDLKKEKLKIGNIDAYSFVIITSINVFNEYKDLSKEKKQNHTFFKMMEHCEKNNFEFYIYDYINNEMYIYDKKINNIKISNEFFEGKKKLDLFNNANDLYEFINSSKKKLSMKFTKNNLLYPIENFYQAERNNKIHIVNLAKYEFNPSMLDMSIKIKDIGLAFWNYDDKKFDNLMINLNKEKASFKGKKIIDNGANIFGNCDVSKIHALLFSIEEEKNIIESKKKTFLQKKRDNKELYFGNFSELEEASKAKKKRLNKK